MAADATYPPDEFIATDGKTVIGMDADLAKAIAPADGPEGRSSRTSTFDSIIPGLAAGKYDLGMSSFTDTKEREKTVDFVTYLTAGTSIYVKADGGPDLTSLDALCGHKVAVEKGTTQQDDIDHAGHRSARPEGKPGVTGEILPDQNGVNLALSSGRADAAMADSPVAAYIVEQSNGQFKVSGGPFPPEPYGIAIPKDSGLTQPVLDAVKALIADGTYKKILEYWGLQARCDHQPGDQWSGQLAESKRRWPRLPAQTDVTGPEPPDEIQAVPVRHPGRWIAAAVVAIVVVVALVSSVGDEPDASSGTSSATTCSTAGSWTARR